MSSPSPPILPQGITLDSLLEHWTIKYHQATIVRECDRYCVKITTSNALIVYHEHFPYDPTYESRTDSQKPSLDPRIQSFIIQHHGGINLFRRDTHHYEVMVSNYSLTSFIVFRIEDFLYDLIESKVWYYEEYAPNVYSIFYIPEEQNTKPKVTLYSYLVEHSKWVSTRIHISQKDNGLDYTESGFRLAATEEVQYSQPTLGSMTYIVNDRSNKRYCVRMPIPTALKQDFPCRFEKLGCVFKTFKYTNEIRRKDQQTKERALQRAIEYRNLIYYKHRFYEHLKPGSN